MPKCQAKERSRETELPHNASNSSRDWNIYYWWRHCPSTGSAEPTDRRRLCPSAWFEPISFLRNTDGQNRSTTSGTGNEAEAHVAPHYERLRRTDASFLLRGAAASIAAKRLQGHKAQYATRTKRWCWNHNETDDGYVTKTPSVVGNSQGPWQNKLGRKNLAKKLGKAKTDKIFVARRWPRLTNVFFDHVKVLPL